MPRINSKPDACTVGVDHIVPYSNVAHKVCLLPSPFGRELYGKVHKVEQGVAGYQAIAGLDDHSPASQVANGVVEDGKIVAVGGR